MTTFEYSAGIFVYRIENGRILFLVLQKSNGEYDLPKGHIEKGERSEEAAIRETKEEAGLEVNLIPFFHADIKYFFFRRKEKVAKGVRYFIAKMDRKKVKISYEHEGYDWLGYDDALNKLKFKTLVTLLPKILDYINRYEKIKEINAQYSKLPKKFGGWDLSSRLVPGEGRLDSKIMLVGQAPGAEEDETGRPFIGRSGILLTEILRKAGIRREDTYITSVVQFFPPKNRMPDSNEIDACFGFLTAQMEVIKPKYVILLGNLSSFAVLGVSGAEINHGKIVKKDGTLYLVTIHPAAVLRFKTKYPLMLDDMKKFKAVIDKSEGSE